MKTVRYAIIAASFLTFFLAGNTLHAQSAIRGQIFLPGGGLPGSPIKIEVENSRGFHDSIYTDSNGRFVLEGMPDSVQVILTVQGDGSNWSETRYTFIPWETQVVRFFLKPYVGSKAAKPPAISAMANYTPDPKIADMHDRGMKAFQAGNVEEAEKLLRQATDADPKYALAFNDLGVILMRERRYADAEPIFRKGLEANPKSVSLLVNLGTDLVHAGKYAEAIPPLREALRLRPEQGDAELQLGASLVETDQLTEAEQMLLAAEKKKGPDDAGVQLYLGKLYSRTGEYAKAIAAFNAFLKLAPPDSPNGPAVREAIQRMQLEIVKH
jgi:Flp pilus assembly protein TadD